MIYLNVLLSSTNDPNLEKKKFTTLKLEKLEPKNFCSLPLKNKNCFQSDFSHLTSKMCPAKAWHEFYLQEQLCARTEEPINEKWKACTSLWLKSTQIMIKHFETEVSGSSLLSNLCWEGDDRERNGQCCSHSDDHRWGVVEGGNGSHHVR